MALGEILVLAVAGVLGAVVAGHDWRERRVPNRLVVALGAIGLVYLGLAADDVAGAAGAFAWGATLGAVLGALWMVAPALVGGADVKVGLALGPFVGTMGWPAPVVVLALAFVLAVPHAAVLLARRADRGVPFVVYLVAAAAIVVAVAEVA